MKYDLTLTIEVDGLLTLTPLPKNGRTLEFLQGKVGGMIQVLPFADMPDVDAWINEEGKYAPYELPNGEVVMGLPVNTVATAIMKQHGLLFEGDWIAGPMVLTSCDDEGNTTGLPGSTILNIVRAHKEVTG